MKRHHFPVDGLSTFHLCFAFLEDLRERLQQPMRATSSLRSFALWGLVGTIALTLLGFSDPAAASFLPADISTTIATMVAELAADAITLLGEILPLLFAVAGPFLALSLVKRFLYSAV